MNWIKEKKIKLLSVFSIITISFYIVFEKKIGKILCLKDIGFCPDLNDLYLLIMILYIPALLIFGTIFITNQTSFEAWKKFSFFYFFIFVFTILVTPWYSGDGFLNIQKGDVAIALSVLYLFLSLLFKR